MPLQLDIYLQLDTQDKNSGAIKKEWSYYKTMKCSAKGIVSNSASARSGDKQTLSTKYSNEQVLEIRSIDQITYREKITNIRDIKGNVVWKELNFPSDSPTVFEVISSTPITDPFGNVIAYNSIAKRSENQQIGI
jgi:hypothetical protein